MIHPDAHLAALLLATDPGLGGLFTWGPPGTGKSLLLHLAAGLLGAQEVAVPPGTAAPEAARLAHNAAVRGAALVAHAWDSLPPAAHHALQEAAMAGAVLLAAALAPPGPDACGLWVPLPGSANAQERSAVLAAHLAEAPAGEAPAATSAAPPGAATAAAPAAVAAARARLCLVAVPEEVLAQLVRTAAALGVASLRADWLAARAARAHAALAGRSAVGAEDVAAAVRLVLAPRAAAQAQAAVNAVSLPGRGAATSSPGAAHLRAAGPPAAGGQNHAGTPATTAHGTVGGRDRAPAGAAPVPHSAGGQSGGAHPAGAHPGATAGRALAAQPVQMPPLVAALAAAAWQGARAAAPRRLASGASAASGGARGGTARSATHAGPAPRPPAGPSGVPVATIPRRQGPWRLAVAATVRAALPWQRLRGGGPGQPLRLAPSDLRVHLCRRPPRELVVLVADASGSMADAPIRRAKGAVAALLREAYRRRARVALIACGGALAGAPSTAATTPALAAGARLVAAPGRDPAAAARALAALPAGGGTPLAAGLALARQVIAAARRRGPCPVALVVVTDGRANWPLQPAPPGWDPTAWVQHEIATQAAELRALGVASLVLDPRPAHLAASPPPAGPGPWSSGTPHTGPAAGAGSTPPASAAQALARVLGGWHLALGAGPRPAGPPHTWGAARAR